MPTKCYTHLSAVKEGDILLFRGGPVYPNVYSSIESTFSFPSPYYFVGGQTGYLSGHQGHVESAVAEL
jgi:hypothetical protein